MLVGVMAAVAVVPVIPIAALRWVRPVVTPFMVARWVTGATIDRQWMPLRAMSPALPRAVVAAEDARFVYHDGFDWTEVQSAVREAERGRRLRGASTITMQCARTVFLWPGRSIVRKVAEAYLTVWIELLWTKRRILEIYLNLVEWGDGIYGCEAAAQHNFGTSCANLSAEQAARLAAILPNPRRWSATHPSPRGQRRVATILARMRAVSVPGR
jgi:monofunctional biosynthetic peptidoglycan transglycosylase